MRLNGESKTQCWGGVEESQTVVVRHGNFAKLILCVNTKLAEAK